MDDLISRQAAIDAALSIGHIAKLTDGDEVIRKSAVNYVLRNLPSAQPSLDEWCTDCKEYDHKRHFCPRFCRMIAEAVKEIRENAKEERHGKWIPHEETTELAPGIKMTAKGYICSECGERFGYAWTWCGNCGAKMDKGEDE